DHRERHPARLVRLRQRPDAHRRRVREGAPEDRGGLMEVERILGVKFPEQKIEFQQTPGGGGGMEHQGLPFVYDGAVADRSRSSNGLFFDPMHEAIHTFFGYGVRIGGWADFTVSEGFVEYLTYRADKKSMGTPEFKRELDQSKVQLSLALDRTPAPLVTPKN